MGAIYYKGQKYGAMPSSAANLPISASDNTDTKSYIDNKVNGLITQAYGSSVALNNNDTWQIPSAALSHKFILLELRRYGYYETILIDTGSISQGLVNAVNNIGGWKYSIDANGVLTNKTGNNDAPPFANVWGIF